MFVDLGTHLESMYTMFELEFVVLQNDTTERRNHMHINTKVLLQAQNCIKAVSPVLQVSEDSYKYEITFEKDWYIINEYTSVS